MPYIQYIVRCFGKIRVHSKFYRFSKTRQIKKVLYYPQKGATPGAQKVLILVKGGGSVEDEKIVELYMGRDEAAIGATAEKYGPRLRSLSFGIVGDWQAAEECENGTYLAAWEAIPPHEPRGYLYAFLARITRHLSLNVCRDRARLKRGAFLQELTAEMEQCLPAPDDLERRLDQLTLRQALDGFLGTLTPEKRYVFLRRYWYMEPIADIARRCGFSQSKVKTMLLRMRRGLKEYFEQEGYDL